MSYACERVSEATAKGLITILLRPLCVGFYAALGQ